MSKRKVKAVKKPLKGEGERCDMCGEIRRRTKLFCEGKKARGEPFKEFLACRCLHPGDYSCNCGRPCFSFF